MMPMRGLYTFLSLFCTVSCCDAVQFPAQFETFRAEKGSLCHRPERQNSYDFRSLLRSTGRIRPCWLWELPSQQQLIDSILCASG